jgi:hypothetical protein
MMVVVCTIVSKSWILLYQIRLSFFIYENSKEELIGACVVSVGQQRISYRGAITTIGRGRYCNSFFSWVSVFVFSFVLLTITLFVTRLLLAGRKMDDDNGEPTVPFFTCEASEDMNVIVARLFRQVATLGRVCHEPLVL